jgi:four helix bundle protein
LPGASNGGTLPIKAYRDLEVSQVSYSLALDISKATRTFPSFEQFEIGRQVRRAARSIPANIVEGWAKRSSAAEFKRFLLIVIGSCDECKLWLDMSRDEAYLAKGICEELQNRMNRVGAMLKSLWRQWRII